jgi:hypothetical protein
MIGKWIRLLLSIGKNKPAKPLITTVINYCSNDYRFIHHCIEQAAVFSQEILVPYTNFFYDGTPEDSELLNRTIAENPKARFIHFDYDPGKNVNAQYWVTFARKIGWKQTSPESNFILFLDADEIVDGAAFSEWLKYYPLDRLNVVKLANYYYFRETHFQALTYEDSVILVRKKLLGESMIMDYEDRNKPYTEITEPKQRMVLGDNSKPMIHHYSWVRTKEEMLKKVKTWGHNKDRDWVYLVEKEFEGEFSGSDFVHGYKYKKVESFI